MAFDPALETYIAESRELLEEMEHGLLNLEQEEDKIESLNAIFRAAHTVKGSAGMFGLDQIVAFTHGVESLLDQLREGQMDVDGDMIEVLLECRDHIVDLIDQVESEDTMESDALDKHGALLTEKLKLLGATTQQDGVKAESVQGGYPQPSESVIERMQSSDQAETDNWHISLRFGVNSFRDGMDPLSFVRYLTQLGQIISIHTLSDAIPEVEEMDAESCYLGFEINFRSDADKEAIDNVFEFIRDDSLIRILPPYSVLEDYLKHIQDLPEEDLRIGEILVLSGSLTQSELDKALKLQSDMKEKHIDRPLGDIVVENSMTSRAVLDAAVDKQTQIRDKKSGENKSVRVDADKLDHLINLIGELVIAGAGSSLNALESGDSTLVESISTLTRLVEEVRDSALRLRMVQIGTTFNRFQRVVRDVSKELNKEIELEISGAETELDKTVIEKIGDPLMHLVRNAIDHGIESAENRIQCGKPPVGRVLLNAYHDSGSIVIEVSDDGAGLDSQRILSKAIEKGLISSDQALDEHEIYNLIFEPGFSTTDQVTNLSGRGVGMDVVKKNITALRGQVDVESKPGKGTVFSVRMPLTLAIIDGFQVGVDKSSFVVPLEMVIECIELNLPATADSSGRDYIDLRGEVLPFIRLRDLFEIEGRSPRRENIVVVQYAGQKAGLVVDSLMGEFQTVIKPLGKIFSHIRCVGGSTILGNGEVALILDVPGLVEQVSSNEFHKEITVV